VVGSIYILALLNVQEANEHSTVPARAQSADGNSTQEASDIKSV
jgi:hypothetical protein